MSTATATPPVPAIATIIDRMKAESGPAKSVDTGELLAELGL